MQQAIKLLNNIKRMELSVIKSKSPYLKNDYEKNIKKMYRDLKKYCYYKNIDYKAFLNKYN